MNIEEIIQFLIFGSETCNKITLDKDDVKTLLEYISYLQRKEYNNEKAIEYLKDNACYSDGEFCDDLDYCDCKELLNILESEVE